jgi:hypothetical protein
MQQEFLASIDQRYRDILTSEKVRPYIFANPDSFNYFDTTVWGLEIEQENFISCLDSKRKHFFHNLQSLDAFSFGPVGMPMERWVFFDCGEMPGGIFGFGIKAQDLPLEVRKQYKYGSDDEEFLPLSMYIAIPMVGGAWFGHNLCSANSVLRPHKMDLPGIALLTKAIGTQVMRIRDHFGATQWASGSLNIHLQLSDMELRSAFTPAHSFDETITYYSLYTPKKIIAALSGQKRAAAGSDFMVDGHDRQRMIELQKLIEQGESFTICGRPCKQDGNTLLPIRKGML